MAYSYVDYTGNGSSTTYSVPFSYISQSHVKVYLNSVLQTTGYTWPTSSSIQFTVAPANGVAIRISRSSSPASPLVVYQDGSTLTQTQLQTANNQSFFLSQEAIDQVVTGGTLTGGAVVGGTIDGATINGSAIGQTTPAAGTFTTLTATGNATLGDAEASDTHAIKGATTLLTNSASAAVTITQTGAGNALVVEDSTSPDSTPFVVDASGNVGIGTTPSGSKINVYDTSNAVLNVAGDGTTAIQSYRYSTDTAAGQLALGKYRGSVSSPTAVASGDLAGQFLFRVYGGTNLRAIANIVSSVGTYTADDDISGVLAFQTRPTGAGATLAERMRIASDGTTTLGGTSTAPALKVIPVASQVNFMQCVGAASGGAAILQNAGSDADINTTYATKGAGVHSFYTTNGGALQVQISHTASANRYITLTGSNGGNPTIGTSGGTLYFAPNSGASRFQADASALAIDIQGRSADDIGVFRMLNNTMSTIQLAIQANSTGATFRTGGNVTQVEVQHTASATRYITLTGSNGANPKISTSAGSLDIGAPLVLTGQTVGTTVGAAGGATALPATPLGYITTSINGTACKIPYYNT